MTSFAFPKDIPVDASHTLDQLTGRFRSVEDGLPELVKNSKDQYSRLGVSNKEDRQIVVLSSKAKRILGVIDFAGARHSDFEGWITWSSRIAGRSNLADDIEAGHGNGGKAFMVHGATRTAFMESCFEGRLTLMGFQNDEPRNRYKPGHAKEGGLSLDNVPEPDPKKRLVRFLAAFGLKYESLPAASRQVFEARNAFTGVSLYEVADWEGKQERTIRRLAAEGLVDLIAGHGQTAQTVETCEVWVLCDGEVVRGSPIRPVALEPYAGFEEPTVITLPSTLTDPETGEKVAVPDWRADTNRLTLRTSRRQLQMSADTKARNVVRVWNQRNNVANWPVQSLGIPITSVSFIYGELRCPAIKGEHLAGAERLNLANTPLARAVREWTYLQVKDLAERLHLAMMAENKPRDRAQANAALKSIRDLMRKYLDPDAGGVDDENDGSGGKGDDEGRRKEREPTVYGSRLDEIILENGRSELALAEGSAVPLVHRCVQRQEDGGALPLLGPPLHLKCEPAGLVALDGQGRLVGMKVGVGTVLLESENGKRSNLLNVEVVAVTSVDITPPDEPLLQGQKLKIAITFRTDEGPRDDLLIEASVDEPDMGLIGRSGRFTAGLKAGEATVRVRFGPDAAHQAVAGLLVGDARVPITGQGGRGSDIPEILLCGDEAPGMEEYPAAMRTHPGGEEHPTIIEEPQFRSVVWINPTSKEAMRVRRSRGGPSGVGSVASTTFMQFVALKCFDVLKRLHVRQQIRDNSVTETEFIQHSALAEIECAAFIDAAWELGDVIRDNLNARVSNAA